MDHVGSLWSISLSTSVHVRLFRHQHLPGRLRPHGESQVSWDLVGLQGGWDGQWGGGEETQALPGQSLESYSLHHQRHHHHHRRRLLLIVSENKLPHVVGLFVQYPEMKKTMGEFTLEIRAGEFTDSEIMVMLGENGTFPPSWNWHVFYGGIMKTLLFIYLCLMCVLLFVCLQAQGRRLSSGCWPEDSNLTVEVSHTHVHHNITRLPWQMYRF